MSVALRLPATVAKPPSYFKTTCFCTGTLVFSPLSKSFDFVDSHCHRNRHRKRSRLNPLSSLPDETVIFSGGTSATIANEEVSIASSSSDASLEVKKKAVELCSSLKGTSIFLLGTSCSIKSRLGVLLADLFSYYFFDSNEVVAQAFGGESFARAAKENDQDGHRESETEVFKQLTAMGRLIVCAGDGAVQNSTILGLLRHGITLWIDVPLGMIASETKQLESDYTKTFSERISQYNEMKSGYSSADVTISLQKIASKLGYEKLNDVTIEDIVIETFKEIEKLTRVKKMIEEAGRPF